MPWTFSEIARAGSFYAGGGPGAITTYTCMSRIAIMHLKLGYFRPACRAIAVILQLTLPHACRRARLEAVTVGFRSQDWLSFPQSDAP
jgi:hypothetical protein